MQSVSIVGIGRVGGALAIALSKAGYTIDLLVHRDPSKVEFVSQQLPDTVRIAPQGSCPDIESDIVLITTADPDIEAASTQLAGHLKNRPAVFHTSGSLSSDILSGIEHSAGSIGSIHPLVSISDAISGAENFKNAYFCIEGRDGADSIARSIVVALGGFSFSIDSKKKSLYHAAAVTACGHLVALMDVAIEMLTACGIEPDAAKEILMPLIKSTVANLETQSPAEALTGSFARVDIEAFDRHLASIDVLGSRDVREIYLALGERSLKLAQAKGADASDLQELRESISIAKRKSGC